MGKKPKRRVILLFPGKLTLMANTAGILFLPSHPELEPPPPEEGGEESVAFAWSATAGATSYVLQVGTTLGGADKYDSNVGNVQAKTLVLATNTTYYSRVIPYNGAAPNGLPYNEQVVVL